MKALSKVAQIGDIAIQHSPEFTALAWAGLRFLLQVAINDLETRENLESAMETITTALGTCAFYEAFYLSSTTEMVKKLAYAMPELYGAVIIFSIKARKWMDARNSGSMDAHTEILSTLSDDLSFRSSASTKRGL